MRYIGQFHEVNINIAREEIEKSSLELISKRFHQRHDQLYGYSTEEKPLELINLRLTCIGRTEKPEFNEAEYQGEDCSRALKGKREIYLEDRDGFVEVEVLDGQFMGYGNKVIGPAIIEQATTTILVPTEYNLVCDRYGNFVMYLKSQEMMYSDRFLI